MGMGTGWGGDKPAHTPGRAWAGVGGWGTSGNTLSVRRVYGVDRFLRAWAHRDFTGGLWASALEGRTARAGGRDCLCHSYLRTRRCYVEGARWDC